MGDPNQITKPRRSKSRDKRRGKSPDEDADEVLTPVVGAQLDASAPSDLSRSNSVPNTKSETMNIRPSPRELRQQRREQLRSKATGLGLSISISKKSPGQKIVFEEEVISGHEPGPESSLAYETASCNLALKGGDEKEDDDAEDEEESDAVEEIKTSVARQEDQKQRDLERTSARATIARKKSRKRHQNKRVNEDASDGETELDEAFFAQLEAERRAERQEKRKKLALLQPAGQKTTFVVEGEEAPVAPTITKPMEHNIQVVVLAPVSTAASTGIATVPTSVTQQFETVTASTLHYSRNLLVDGSDVLSARQQHRARKNGKKNTTTVTGWKRSKKMNRLLTTPGVMSSRKRQKAGGAAPHFVVRC